jgi:hypothetical protein
MEPRECKSFDFEVKATNEGVIEGIASVMGVPDLGGDLIQLGAFDETLRENSSMLLLWQHDPHEPIDKAELTPEGNKLRMRARVDMTDDMARHAFKKVKAGLVKGLSIGFSALKWSFQKAGHEMQRMLESVKLWEVSLVTFFMQPAAQVTSVRSMGNLTQRELEKDLHEHCGFSRRKAAALVSAGWSVAAGTPDSDPEADLAEFLRHQIELHSGRGDPLEVVIPRA